MKDFVLKRTTVRWAPRVNQFVRFPLVNPYGRPRPALPRAGPLPLQLVVYLIRPSWAHCRRPLARPRACHKASLAIETPAHGARVMPRTGPAHTCGDGSEQVHVAPTHGPPWPHLGRPRGPEGPPRYTESAGGVWGGRNARPRCSGHAPFGPAHRHGNGHSWGDHGAQPPTQAARRGRAGPGGEGGRRGRRRRTQRHPGARAQARVLRAG